MAEKSVDITRFVNNDYTLVANQQEPKGEKMMRAFASLVRGASTLDGDLRLNNRKIEKVNYGSIRLFGNRAVKTSMADNVKVRDLFRDSVDAYLDGVLEKLNGGGNVRGGLTVENIEGLREKCRQIIGDKVALAGPMPFEIAPQGAKPLSRRTVCQVIQMIDDAVNLEPGQLTTEREQLLGRVETRKYDGEPWRLVGGTDGMRMTRKHFESMFDEALTIASEITPAYKPAYEKQIAYYKRLFDENRTGGELEVFFTGSLDAKTIARKMHERIESGIAPELPGERKRHALTGAVGREMHDKYVNLRTLREQVGELRLNEKVDISAVNQQSQAAVPAVDAAEKELLSELLLNKSVEELENCGFTGGERLGRVFYRNLDAFNDLCANVRAREAARKTPHVEVPKQGKVLSALSLVSPDVANALEKLIVRLDAKVFKGRPATKTSFFAAAQDIFAIIDGAKFEDAIDAGLRKALDEHGVISKLLAVLRTASQGDDLAFVAVRNGIENADAVTLRRMFASCLTVAPAEEMPKDGDGVEYGKLLKGLGPYTLKLLQRIESTKIDAQKGPLHASVQKALEEIKSGLDPIDEDTIKADLVDYVKRNRDIVGITVKSTLNSATVGQTMLCTVRMRDTHGDVVEKDVIYKLLRPGVGERMEQEMSRVGEQLERIASGRDRHYHIFDVARLRDLHKVNVDQMLPESDFTNEAVNALMGINAYDPPASNKRVMSFFNKLLANQKTDFTIPSLYGSEKLVLKPEYRNDEGVQAALTAIKRCKKREDYLKPEVQKFFLPASRNSLLIEVAKGQVMSTYLSGLEERVNDALNSSADQASPKLKAAKEETRKAFEALLQLSAGFVKAALVDEGHFIHADLHLGNLMFDEASGKVTIIDYGRAAHLSAGTADALRKLLKFGRTGFPRPAVGEQSAGAQLVAIYRQMLDAEKTANRDVQQTLDWLANPANVAKLEEAFVSFARRTDCTVGNILDNFMETIATVPGMRDLPRPKEVLAFQTAFDQLQRTVSSLQRKINSIDQALATSQSANYSDDDLNNLVSLFGPGGEYELQNIGYPKVEISDYMDPKWQNHTLTVTLNDDKVPFEGTGKSTVSSVVLQRVIEMAKRNKGGPRQRYVALSTILRILTEEENRLKAFDIKKCCEEMKTLEKDLSVTKAKFANGLKETSVQFVLGNKTLTRDALRKIEEEKTKILAAMETLKPHCTTETLYVNNKKLQDETLPFVSVDTGAVRFERTAASASDIVIAGVLGYMQKNIYGFGALEDVFIPECVVNRFARVRDIRSNWSDLLFLSTTPGIQRYTKHVDMLTTNAKKLKWHSFYNLPLESDTYEMGDPWEEDEDARVLTAEERKGYGRFYQLARNDLGANDLPAEMPERVTLADYRRLIERIAYSLNIFDLSKLQIDEDIDEESYEDKAKHPSILEPGKIPALEPIRQLHKDGYPSLKKLRDIELKGLAADAYGKLATQIAEKDKDWQRADSPTALDYALAYDRLCELELRAPAELENELCRILDLQKLEEADCFDDFRERVPNIAKDADAVRKLASIYANYSQNVDKKTAEKYNVLVRKAKKTDPECDLYEVDVDDPKLTYEDYFNTLLELESALTEAQWIETIKGITVREAASSEDEPSVLEKHGVRPTGILLHAFDGFDWSDKMPDDLQAAYQKLVNDPEAERVTFAVYLEEFIKVRHLNDGDPKILKEAARLVGIQFNRNSSKEPTLSLPEYLQYARTARTKGIELDEQETYGDVLPAYREKEPTPKEMPLTKEDQRTFNKLLKDALAYRIAGAEEIKARLGENIATLKDYLDLADVVRAAQKNQTKLNQEHRLVLDRLVLITRALPFSMFGADYNPDDYASCAKFVMKILCFSRNMILRESQWEAKLYAKIAEFNAKQKNAQKPTVVLPDKEKWDALSFYDVRAYLDRYLKLAYPGRDIANELFANNCDFGNAQLNDEGLAAYRELEDFAMDNNLIKRPALQPGLGQNEVVVESPKTYADLKELYEKVDAYQRSFPRVGDGDGFEVTVGGVLN